MNIAETSPEASTRLIPVPEWPKIHPWPTKAALRHLCHHADRNGFEKVIRRVGRRVLIDERAFFAWVEEQNVRSPMEGRAQ